MADIVQPQVDCLSAEEFLDKLSPLKPDFEIDENNGIWLFRGQGQDWKLIPSLFRKDGKMKSLTNRNIENDKELHRAERDILIQFFEIADKRGLILPDDSQELRSHLTSLKNDLNLQVQRQSEMKLWSLKALAQHYGIPTCLLDWTRKAYIAAYFAAEDAHKHNDEYAPASSLVVWAFHFPKLPNPEKYGPHTPIRIVTAPGATNSNLRAQQGVFTWMDSEYIKELKNEYLPLDQVLEGLVENEYVGRVVRDCKLRKYTLPLHATRELLHILTKLDITPSAIYPGYQSIVSDLQMQGYLESS
jgi:hypothetical protein